MKQLRFNYSMVRAAEKNGLDAEGLGKLAEGSKKYTELQSKVIEERLAGLEKTEASIGNFDSPNWANREAFILGAKAELRWVLSILNNEVD